MSNSMRHGRTSPYLDVAHHAGAILALLVRRLRQAWPDVKIVFRGDSGFCRPLILNWCDRHDVDYIIGIAGNKRLAKLALDIDYASAIRFEKTWEKQRVFGFIKYAAGSWKKRRRQVIVKSETSGVWSSSRRCAPPSRRHVSRYRHSTRSAGR
ncbi:transposase [Halomonas sp. M4R5S39]|nr:transposase [Halomonas kalidii]MDI5985626.1 transposase [Halomonas kalidii]